MGKKGSPSEIKNRLGMELDPTRIGEKLKYDIDPLKHEREEYRDEERRKQAAADEAYQKRQAAKEQATSQAAIATEERRKRAQSGLKAASARRPRKASLKPSLIDVFRDKSETLG